MQMMGLQKLTIVMIQSWFALKKKEEKSGNASLLYLLKPLFSMAYRVCMHPKHTTRLF